VSVKSVNFIHFSTKSYTDLCVFDTVLEVCRAPCSRTTFQWFVSKDRRLSLHPCWLHSSGHMSDPLWSVTSRLKGGWGEVPRYCSETSPHTHNTHSVEHAFLCDRMISSFPECVVQCLTKLLELLKVGSSIDGFSLWQKLNWYLLSTS
jgi:hypothetical protein